MRPRETYDDWVKVPKTNAVALKMKLARETCETVARGGLPVAYLSGPPGIGKTQAVRDAVGERHVRSNPTNYRDLLAAFAQADAQGVPLWLDEADVIFRTDRMLNVLKVATGARRERVYNGQRLDVPLFVTTNQSLDAREIGGWWDKGLLPHATALFNRSHPVVITGDALELWEYSVYVAQTTRMLANDEDGDGIPLGVRNDALDWFTYNVHRLDVVAPRTLAKACDLMARSRKPNPTISHLVATATLDAMLTRDPGGHGVSGESRRLG
jgi:DNA polymerase III delta prime subunit